LGGNVLIGAAGDFVAELKVFHQLQQFVPEVGVSTCPEFG